MFDLIVLYFVISMIVNLVKSGKEQTQKQEQQKQVRRPQKKEKTSSPMVSSKPIQPGSGKTVGNLPKMQSSSLPKIEPTLADAGEIKIMIGENPATVATKTVKTGAIPVITSDKNDEMREKVQQVFVPSEENILTGIVWSEILGPPVCKRRR